MKILKNLYQINMVVLYLFTSFLLYACGNDPEIKPSPNQLQFGVFTVLNDTTVELNGTINSASLRNFNTLLVTYPNVKDLKIVNCDGSSDDEVNLQLSSLVHQRNMRIHLNNNGLVASGGTDFFLAGTKRTKGANTRFGVHSWAGEDDGGNMVSATDFPVGHEFHLPYINYYVSVGFTQQQAEDFYYFTINAASAEDIHWMTDEEIEQYNILTE